MPRVDDVAWPAQLDGVQLDRAADVVHLHRLGQDDLSLAVDARYPAPWRSGEASRPSDVEIATRAQDAELHALVPDDQHDGPARVDARPRRAMQASVTTTANAININTATAEELDQLPHVGRKTAEKIIQFREENGPFRRVEHVMQIRGISEKRFLELQPFLKAE